MIHLGRWQDALPDVTCDALIFDAPHSRTTSDSATKRSDGYASAGLRPSYDAFTAADVREVVESWSPRTRGWFVSVTDWPLSFTWKAELERAGRYVFDPVLIVIRAMSVRAQHDGPSSWGLYAVVARPPTREFAEWGVLDGAYVGGCGGNGRAGGSERSGGRGKPAWLMRALVRDYSRPGDLVCDPFAGWGATGAAALGLGRRFVGAEADAAAYDEARRRLARPLQIDLLDTG